MPLKKQSTSEYSQASSVEVTETSTEVERVQWGSYAEYILSAVGYCIGYGNVWRFPYRTFSNGGGAFLIPYAFMLITVGIPFFFIEQALAQFSSRGPTAVWNFCPILKGIGYSMYLLNFITSLYYNVILGWAIYYLIHSMTTQLPWDGCDNPWNSENCNAMLSSCSKKGGIMDGLVCRMDVNKTQSVFEPHKHEFISSSEEFWNNKVLDKSSGIDELGKILLPQYASFVFSQFALYLILIKGVSSSGKVVFITATAPFVLLFILLVRGLTLPGMSDGIKFFISPDFNKLTDVTVWGSAANQIVYSLGLGFGATQTISSFKPFNTNCERDTLIVSFSNCGTSVFAGFSVFSILGYLAYKLGTTVPNAVRDGLGLAFIAYPDVTLELPISPLWAILFFLMMVNIGLDTVVISIEAAVTPLLDEVPSLKPHRRHVTYVVVLLMTALALPVCTSSGIYWFKLLDWYGAWYPLFLLEIIQAVAVAYIYGVRRFSIDIETMIGKPPNFIWKIFWLSVSPLVLAFVLFNNIVSFSGITLGDYEYPSWADAVGWVIMTIELLPIPIYAVYRVINTEGDSLGERIRINLRPTEDWGPVNPQDRERNNRLIREKLGTNYLTDWTRHQYQ